MLKQLTTVLALATSTLTFSQVGIGTETPKATLDVVGKPTETTVLDGVIAPRITGVQLRAKNYTSNQRGALVYVTDADTAPAGQTQDVTVEGYYYFNGSKWIPSNGYNIYTADGSLTGSGIRRTLNLNGNELNFVGSQQSTEWSQSGMLNQRNEQSGTGAASFMMRGGNNSNLQIQQFYNSNTEIAVTGNSTGIAINTAFTTNPAPITFGTNPGGSNNVERIRITGSGNTGINTQYPTEKLDIDGITRVRKLPLNGATNAHHTISGDNASTTQNQTFTATRTVVADANGVLGYLEGLPSTGGAPSDGGTIAVGEKIRWQGEVSAQVGGTGGGNTQTSNDPTWYLSYYHSNLPVIEGIRIDPYFIQRASTGNTNILYRIINASAGNIKVAYHSMNISGSTSQWGDTNIIFGPGQFINSAPVGHGNSGENMTTASTPANYQTTTTTAIRTVITDLWVNNRWYRVNYLIVVDNNNTTDMSDDIRKVNITVERIM